MVASAASGSGAEGATSRPTTHAATYANPATASARRPSARRTADTLLCGTALATDDLVERRMGGERHGRGALLELRLLDRLPERQRARPARDVHEAEVRRAEAAVQPRPEVAGLGGQELACPMPAFHEGVVGLGGHLERVDED